MAALTLVVVVVAFVAILPRFADYEDTWGAIRSLSPTWLAGLLVAAVAALAAPTLQWPGTAPELTLRPSFSIATTSFAIGSGVPGGGAVVIPIQYSMLTDQGMPRSRASAVAGVNAVFTLLTIGVIPLAGACLIAATDPTSPSRWPLILAGAGAIAAVVLGLRGLVRSEATAQRIGDGAGRLAERVARAVRRPHVFAWGGAVTRWRASAAEILTRRWAPIVGAHLAAHLTQYAVLAVALAALEQGDADRTSIVASFFAFGVGRLGTLVPITPGGLGTVDSVLAGLLVGTSGTSGTDAVAAVLIWRALTLAPGLLVGGAAFVAWRRRLRGRT